MQELIRDFRIDVQQSPSILRAPLANDYIQHLGMTLARQTHDKNIHYAFFINDSEEINAFAGPGGTVVIHSELILSTHKEDELAAVMAHEIAHSEQKHWLSDINRQKTNQASTIASGLTALALGLINPALSQGALIGGLAGVSQSEINHIRSHEREADRIGIQLLYDANYNPQGMVDFLKELQNANQSHNMNAIPAILLTHPLDEERISDAQNRVEQLPKKHYTSNPDYFLVKEIIRVKTAKKASSLIPYYQSKLKKSPKKAALRYGYAITLLKVLKFSTAKLILQDLYNRSPNNYYYELALCASELGLKQTKSALSHLKNLYQNHPDNLAIILDYSTALIQFNQTAQATNILSEGLNDYPNNVLLLQHLAEAEFRNHQTARAYLTRAKVFLQSGQLREAHIALMNAKKAANHDTLLLAQINAQLIQLKELSLQKQDKSSWF